MTSSRRRLTSAAGSGGWALCAALLLGMWLAPPPAVRAAESASRPLNVWPFYDERDDPVDRAHTRSSLGPLLEFDQARDGTTEEFSLRPLFHRREDKTMQRLEWEVLYPLMSYSRTEQDWEFQFLQVMNFRAEGSLPTERERRDDFFPFYLSGTTEDGEHYRAVLPFGGRVLNRLGQDEAEFVMFPLYARLVKKDVETRYFPWPFVSRTRGERRSGFRVIPFYGHDRKEGVFEKRFVLWPFFLQQRTGLDEDSPEETFSILPFYVAQRSKARDSTTILWPFFTHSNDRERRFEQWDFPWPFIKIARGESRTINRFLPLFSVEERLLQHEFLLREMRSRDLVVLYPIIFPPLYTRNEVEIPGSLKVRHRILWYLYSDEREDGQDGSTRRVDAWPFFRYTRDREGRIEFQTLALLEAFLPGNEKFEQNYSPLWALYTYRRNGEGDAVRSFLWNLVRHEETSAGRSIEFLGPILAYREGEDDAHLSLLGGLLEYDVRHGVRSVRLFQDATFRWAAPPQPVAVLPPTGGMR